MTSALSFNISLWTYLFYNGVIIIPARHIEGSRARRGGEEMKQEGSGSRSKTSNLKIDKLFNQMIYSAHTHTNTHSHTNTVDGNKGNR